VIINEIYGLYIRTSDCFEINFLCDGNILIIESLIDEISSVQTKATKLPNPHSTCAINLQSTRPPIDPVAPNAVKQSPLLASHNDTAVQPASLHAPTA
jgi:hypothetical protein